MCCKEQLEERGGGVDSGPGAAAVAVKTYVYIPEQSFVFQCLSHQLCLNEAEKKQMEIS